MDVFRTQGLRAASAGAPDWMRRIPRILLGALIALSLAGCGPRDPLESKVDASTYTSFALWRSRLGERLSPGQVRDVDLAIQEIRFRIMAEGKASGSEAIDQAMMEAIHESTVRRVLQMGLGWGLKRSQEERATLETAMNQNALMRTRPGDTESSQYLVDLRERQASRLEAAKQEEAKFRKALEEAGVASDTDAAPHS